MSKYIIIVLLSTIYLASSENCTDLLKSQDHYCNPSGAVFSSALIMDYNLKCVNIKKDIDRLNCTLLAPKCVTNTHKTFVDDCVIKLCKFRCSLIAENKGVNVTESYCNNNYCTCVESICV